jgi:hypothetical protein
MSTTTDLRPALFETYKYVVNNWAVSASDVAGGTGRELKEVNSLLRRLGGLVVGDHVNGERELTWQSYHDVQNEKGAQAASTRDFNKAFPKGEPVPAGRTGGAGATGPRYTEEQLKDAEARREAGESFKAIGLALDIKATAYLSRVLKRRAYEREQAAKDAKRSRGRKATTKVGG